MQRRIGLLFGLGTDKILSTTEELFAYSLSAKLGDIYYFSEEEMLGFLNKKPTEPNKFGYFMDHAYFSATLLFKKLNGATVLACFHGLDHIAGVSGNGIKTIGFDHGLCYGFHASVPPSVTMPGRVCQHLPA